MTTGNSVWQISLIMIERVSETGCYGHQDENILNRKDLEISTTFD